MKANISRLYEHYCKVNYTKAKEDLEAKYPELVEVKEEIKTEVKESVKKSKGK